jgi:hypothetical protein
MPPELSYEGLRFDFGWHRNQEVLQSRERYSSITRNLKRLYLPKRLSHPNRSTTLSDHAEETFLPLLLVWFSRSSRNNHGIAYQSRRPQLFAINTQLLLLVIVGHTRLGGTAAAEPSSK